MAKGDNDTRATALLFSFSAVVLVLLARAVLLQPPDRRPGGADILLAALDRFLDGRGLLDLATRRNMVLLCHAILLVILRDAGLLGAPARRRAAATESAASAVVADGADIGAGAAEEGAFRAPVLDDAAELAEGSIVVWRRPSAKRQNAHHHDDGSGRRLVRRRQPRRSAAQQHPAAAVAPAPIRFAAPAMAEQPEQHQPPMLSKAIVLVEDVRRPRNHLLLDDHDRAAAAVVELDLPAATPTDGKKSGFDRRIVDAGDERNVGTAAAEEMTPELADDRRIEEFIAKQWSTIRHESLQLALDRSSSGSQSQAITAC